jgi:hypothetical protein
MMFGLLLLVLASLGGPQDPPPNPGLLIEHPNAAAIERCSRSTVTEPRQSLRMRCRIADGRADGDCELLNPTPETSGTNVAAAQCILRATRWTHRDGSPAQGVVSVQTLVLGSR